MSDNQKYMMSHCQLLDEFNAIVDCGEYYRIDCSVTNALYVLSTYIDAPRVGGGVYHALQIRGDVLPVRQQLRQGLRAQNVPKRQNIILSFACINVSYQ